MEGLKEREQQQHNTKQSSNGKEVHSEYGIEMKRIQNTTSTH